MKAIYTPTPTHIQSFCKVFLFACLLTITQNATATIRYVSQWGTGGGTSWSDASGDLKAMIDASQPGNEVWVLEGMYPKPDNQPIVMRPGVKIYGGFYGAETSPAQRDLSQHMTLLTPFDNEVIIQNINNGLTIIWNATYARWEVTFDFTGTNGFFVTSEIDVLPLTLLNFNGRTYNGYNQLQWETADEVNTSHFILERSTNGNTYTSVATIPAGNSVYSYKDNISFNGKLYYRLKMVDKDGQFTYSTIVTLNNNGASTVSIYPNPANDKVYLNTGSELLQHSARLYDVSGHLLQTIQITNTLQAIPVQHLKSGLYLLQFDNGTTAKFIKK